MIHMMIRIVNYLSRFLTSIGTLGVINAVKIVICGRFSDRELKIILPDGSPFYFRGRLDQGVMSHFYKEGYVIEDKDSFRVKTIIDVGANIGDETARFFFHHPEAEIVAIEAAECNFSLLKKNFSHIKNVQLFQGALWPTKTHLKLINSGGMENFSVAETSDASESVETWTVPDIMKRMKWDKIDILKLDIEGAEYDVFTKNYQEWIDKVNVFIFEIPDHDRPGSTQVIYRALNGHGYNSYLCGENLILIRAELPWRLRKVIGFIS